MEDWVEGRMYYNEWVEKFKPIKNPEGDDIVWERGKDLEILSEKDSHYVWTNIMCDGWDVIQPGWHRVNRTGEYYFTEVAWEEGVFVEAVIESPYEENWECEECGKFINNFEYEESDGLCKECAAKKNIVED